MATPLTVDDWPPPPIRTSRLVLRPPEARDRAAFLDLGTDDEVNRHLGGGRDRATLDAELPAVPADRPGQFVVEHDGAFVAWFGLGRRDPARPGADHVDEPRPDLELSYVTPRSAWGHGYATEAAAAVLAWADAVLDEPVVLCTQSSNARSLALAGRLGFIEVARFEEFGAEQWFGVRHPGVRRATPADARQVARVAEAAYSPYLERMDGARPGPLDADYAAAVTDSEAWVVERDGAVIAFLLLVPEGDAMLLDNVAVLPAHHGTGIGRALLALAEGRARALGLDRIRLFTHVTMVENQRLYERLGYVETHRGGESGLVRVFYEKPLGAPASNIQGTSKIYPRQP
jgi:RimJ/RimL family protein N-acetyltransferase